MKISTNSHLTYCTNIHPGEHWNDVFDSLNTYTLALKKKLSPDAPFGVGLRLSNEASKEILDGNQLAHFKDWLEQEGLYVFTFNGFPYGGFHRQKVKDVVHQPDWTTRERVEYTQRLFDILAYLLPEGVDGGISTSPISYRHWFSHEPEGLEKAWEKGCLHVAEIAAYLHKLKQEKGIDLHLDIEPEPDGFLENTAEVVEFYEKRLIPIGGAYLQEKLGVSASEAARILYQHIQICYDVCHFAVVYEAPAHTFDVWEKAGIKIGKVQISAALQAEFAADPTERTSMVEAFEALNESTYLHQVVAKQRDDSLLHFNDLPDALSHIRDPQTVEWRTHFHVPVFVNTYGLLTSTQESIVDVLTQHIPDTAHWEVETYTWEVLPEEIRFGLGESIERELQWVLSKMT